ncbi:transcription factor bHLH162-like protein [Cinnamomum micranthum f. kanehirae]|uniref:Transcription factor bHLH162-like protein n=1 Tax=Cinnamomum micranthum f. kanehirae TaxID=337451 RepID=A0A443NU23_9MAGN|nr:transcription factor bHLH162-like protein [Cinnamomum micranthum f. kanehirae]
MKSSQSSSSKLERKTLEKNRRMNMKSLCFKLSSLTPSDSPKMALSMPDKLEQATEYIRNLQENIEALKKKRDLASHIVETSKDVTDGMMIGFRLPVIEVRESGSAVEVLLITGLKKNFMLCNVISIIEEEGAQVVNASFSCTADMVFHIIHSQVTSSRVGFGSARVHERLKELVYWT